MPIISERQLFIQEILHVVNDLEQISRIALDCDMDEMSSDSSQSLAASESDSSSSSSSSCSSSSSSSSSIWFKFVSERHRYRSSYESKSPPCAGSWVGRLCNARRRPSQGYVQLKLNFRFQYAHKIL